jgi:hypothetical protein
MMFGNSRNAAYRFGVGVALLAAFLQVWMNLAVGIVGSEDNPTNLGFFGVVATAGACAFTARFRAEGMARAMVAVAGVQAMLAVVIATAPSNARDAVVVLVLSGVFTLLWLASAALFQRSSEPSARDAIA